MGGLGRLTLSILFLCLADEFRAYEVSTEYYNVTNLYACDDQPFKIKDPFPHDVIEGPDFIDLKWLRVLDNATDSTAEPLAKVTQNSTEMIFISLHDRISRHGFWGISMDSFTQADVGIYIAVLSLENEKTERAYEATMPLKSPKLFNKDHVISLFPIFRINGEAEMVCGSAVKSFGKPRLEMIFVHENGTRVKGRYTPDGYTMIINKETAAKLRFPEESVTIKCQIDETKFLRYSACVDPLRWMAEYTFQEKDRAYRVKKTNRRR